jgi:hypothetical protein
VKLWMNVMRDLESVMNDHELLFDAWMEGGVDGLVIGPLAFNAEKLLPGTVFVRGDAPPAATFDPNPEVYRRLGVEAPSPPAAHPDQRRLLEKTLAAAEARSLTVSLMYTDAGAGPGGPGYPLHDETTLRARVARMIDTLEHYPTAAGAVMDGPEWGYEIAPHHMDHRSYLFHDLPSEVEPLCASLGYDYPALVAAKDRLFERLHRLTPRDVALARGGGLLGAFQLFGSDPDLLAWIRFRYEAMSSYLRRLRALLDAEMSRPIRLSIGPRSAAFAPLTGMDLGDLAGFMDRLHPKHYFWHRGFDGFVGTVHRWVEVLTELSPALSDADALAVVELLFGIELPGVSSRADFETALSPEFYWEVVGRETGRALAAVEDPERIIPWVDAGRFPHDGDPMPARDLRLLLESAEQAGLKRFLYHHQGNLTAGEWTVISDMCGERWDPRRTRYRPAGALYL